MISSLVKEVISSPMNLPIWVKLSKYPIDQNDIKENIGNKNELLFYSQYILPGCTTKRDILKNFFNALIAVTNIKMDGFTKHQMATYFDEELFSK